MCKVCMFAVKNSKSEPGGVLGELRGSEIRGKKAGIPTEHSRPATLLTLTAKHVHDSIYMVQGYRLEIRG